MEYKDKEKPKGSLHFFLSLAELLWGQERSPTLVALKRVKSKLMG